MKWKWMTIVQSAMTVACFSEGAYIRSHSGGAWAAPFFVVGLLLLGITLGTAVVWLVFRDDVGGP